MYSRRLVKDLEAEGIIRTAVKSVNLALHADHKDVLMAECIRTFPSVTFPASWLLRREEEGDQRAVERLAEQVPLVREPLAERHAARLRPSAGALRELHLVELAQAAQISPNAWVQARMAEQ